MFKIAARNRSINERLTLLEKATLNEIIKAFAKDLHDENVKKKIIRELIISDRFLRELFAIAKNADRFKKK